MQTLPSNNLITVILYCQLISKLRCTKCGGYHFWKHGFYQRRRIYFSEAIDIQRYLCLEPDCKSTFSLKPVPLLPYCRFTLWHLIQVDEMFSSGISSYKIAKSLDVPISVILRIKHYLKNVHNFINSEWRIADKFSGAAFLLKWIALIKKLSWFDLCRRYFHTIYPLRVLEGKTHIE